MFSEFAEQYFKDRFDKEEKIFANTLKHLSGNIEFHFKRFIEFCSVRIKFNKNNKKLMYNYQDYISKFFTFKRKISDHYIEFLKLKDIENLKARSSEDGLIKAQNEWVIIIDIQKVFNGVFDLRKKRIEAEFNNYVHHFLNTIDTDFYNEWVQK